MTVGPNDRASADVIRSRVFFQHFPAYVTRRVDKCPTSRNGYPWNCINYDKTLLSTTTYMEVDNIKASQLNTQLQQPAPVEVPAAAVTEKTGEHQTTARITHGQPTLSMKAEPSSPNQDTAMLTEELPDGSIKASKESTSTPRVSRISDAELEALYASLESCKKELAQARQNERRNAALASNLASMERERDRYRAVSLLFEIYSMWMRLLINGGVCSTQTVLSLAYQNKVLNDELTRSRKVGYSILFKRSYDLLLTYSLQGLSGREEKYVDARLQIQDLKEALALKEREVEELQAARDYVPTSVSSTTNQSPTDYHEEY